LQEESSDEEVASLGVVDYDELLGSESVISDVESSLRGANSGGEVWSWEKLEELPTKPVSVWEPAKSGEEWAACLFGQFPRPLQRWVEDFEPGMCGWRAHWVGVESVLEVLAEFTMQFQPRERRMAMKWLFERKGLLQGEDSDMFDWLFCKFPADFGHVDFKVGDEMGKARLILAVADRFFCLLDDCGFSECLYWAPEPRVKDPENFRAGGIHSDSAKEAWNRMPGVSSHVLHWVHNKVWFKKKSHVVEQEVKNAGTVTEGSRLFDSEMFQFLDGKIKELVRSEAVVPLPAGIKPDVVTRLSLAPKPGEGKEKWRIIMDMRPENLRHYSKKVRMEHLAHFATIFSTRHLLFSLDLKSAYFSVGVDERMARTMGFQWRGCFYKFACLPFGFKLSPYAFVKVGRQIVKKWRLMGPGQDWGSRFRGWRDRRSRLW
jgi:hypothetical protein